MSLVELFKKIFLPSYTDKIVDPLVRKNAAKLNEAADAIGAQGDDVAAKIFVAMGGKHGN